MGRLPQGEPSDRDVDEFIDRISQRLVHGTNAREHLLVQLELTSLRRYCARLRRRLRDRDSEILDLRDQLVGGSSK